MVIYAGLQKLIPSLLKRHGAARAIKAGAPRLRELGRVLERVNAETENDFLVIGGHLQNFSERAREISGVSAAAAGRIGGAELSRAIDELRAIFQQTQQLAKECEMGTDVLGEILGLLEMVQSSVSGFIRIVKTLTVLGTFIRVESARLDNMGADFSTLAGEINQLGSDIDEKYKNIFEKSQSLSSLLKQSLSDVLDIKNNQKDQLHLVFNNTLITLDSLTGKSELSSSTTRSIGDNYRNISQKISDIVISLQFHDITRQQIEHVQQALSGVLSLLEDRSAKNGKQQKILSLFKDICQIQEAQLAVARDKLNQAVRAIIGGLDSIARDISAISGQVQELAGDVSREGNSFLAEMKEHLAAVAAGLNLYGAARRDLTGLLEKVAPAVGDMAKFLVDIERIEIAIERLALNASIKAAHLGMEGSVLGVLAEATQSLVGDTRQQTLAVSAHLQAINVAARKLAAEQGGLGEQAAVDVAALTGKLEEVLATLSGLNEDLISGLSEVDFQGKKLSADLARAGGEITVHEYAVPELDRVIAGIDALAGELQTCLKGKTPAGPEDEELLRLKAQYTMVDERKAHERIVAAGPAAPGGNRPLFDHHEAGTDTGMAPEELAPKGEDDFGDNVELF